MEKEPARVVVLMRPPASLPFVDAVKHCIGSVREFAQRAGVNETAVSGLINGSAVHPYHRERDALAEELGVSRDWLDVHIDQARQARV